MHKNIHVHCICNVNQASLQSCQFKTATFYYHYWASAWQNLQNCMSSQDSDQPAHPFDWSWSSLDTLHSQGFIAASSWQWKLWSDYWYRLNLSLITRKIVLGGLRPGKTQTVSEASYSLESLDLVSRDIILSKQRMTKTLIRLRGCAGWSASLLLAYSIKQIFTWCGSLSLGIWLHTHLGFVMPLVRILTD